MKEKINKIKNRVKLFFTSGIKKGFLILFCLFRHPKKFYNELSKRSQKWILRGLVVFLIILIGVPFSLWYGSKKTEAAWWNDSWQYRKSIAVTNSSGGALTDFQVKILDNKDLSADITAGKIQASLSDLRFTDINGKVLPYWIEDTTTTSVDVWTKLPSIPTSGATVYMYYGNATVASAQNGNNVFEFFDDFSGSSIDSSKWDVTGTMMSIYNGRLRADRASGTGNIFSKITYSRQFVLDMDFYPTQYPNGWEGSYHGSMSFGTFNSSKTQEHSWTPYGGGGNSFCGFCDDGGCYHGQYVNPVVTGNTLYKISMRAQSLISGPQGVMTYSNVKYDGGGSQASGTIYTGATTGDDPLYIGVADYGGNTSDDFEWDNWRIRKYASTDPSAGTPATEEKGIGPIAYWSFDEGQGTTAYDSTSNQNNGTFLSAPVWKNESECVSGKCLAFDNVDDGVSINKNFVDLTDYTMSAWINLKGTHQHYTGTIMSSGDWNTNHWAFGIGQNNDLIKFNNPDGSTWFQKSYSFSLDNWYYVSVVRSNTTLTYYVNGKSVGTSTIGTGQLVSNATNTTIGRETYAGGYFAFNGLIDEPKIYSYARSAKQIAMDYNVGLAGTDGAEGASVSLGAKSQKWMTDGLVGYWKMDENSWGSVVDSSGNSLNGTANSGATVAAGKFGNGGSFDGSDDYVSTSAYTVATTTTPITYNAWVKRSGACNNYNVIISHDITNGSGGPVLMCGVTGHTNELFLYSGANYFYSGYVLGTDWTLVSMVFDGSVIKIYANGVLVYTSASTTITAGASPFTIGGRWGTYNGYYFPGSIDEARIYNRALSPNEISDLYNFAPGPIVEWKLDENTGTTGYDTSGNGRNLSFGNTPTWIQGKFGSALDFDRGDYAYQDWTDFTIYTQTIEFWVKADSLSGGWEDLVGTYLGTDINRFHFYSGTSAISFYSVNGNCGTLNSGVVPVVGQWYHVAGTTDGTTARIYIDGQQKSSVACSTNYTSTGVYLAGPSGETFDGKLDDVRIYNYARTSAQIMADYGTGQAQKQPIGYWKFNEGYGTAINNSGIGGSGLNGIISGATWSGDGKSGKALQFNGSSSYAYVSDNDSLDMRTGGYSASAWIKVSAPTPNHAVIVEKGGSNGTAAGFWWSVNTNGLMDFYVNNGSTYIVNALSGVKNVADNAWHHVAFSWDPAVGVKLYVDGKLDNSISVTTTVDINTTDILRIGGFSSAGFSLNGNVDEVKVYNYSLTSDEIALDYNQGKSIAMGSSGTTATGTASNSADRAYCPPGDTTATCAPTAEWKFDEGSGLTANNTVGSGNYGTLTNGPTWISGKIGKALSFDGSDDSVVLNSTITPGNGSWTVSAWAKTSANGSILSNNSGGPVTSDMGIANNKIFYNSYNGSWVQNYGTSTVTNNAWHYLTWVNHSNTMDLYVDGKAENLGFSSTTSNGGPVNSIGRNYAASLNGLIDNVVYYNYARTPAQIAWEFNRGAPVGWWKMDEGQGTTVNDSSGNNNIGTMTNMDPPNDWVAGKINKALDFDGDNDYVNVGQNINFGSGAFSIAFWAYGKTRIDWVPGLISRSVTGDFSAGCSGTCKGWVVGLTSGSDTALSLKLSDGGATGNDGVNTVLTLNQWDHFVFTVAAGEGSNKINVYKDGVLVSSASRTSLSSASIDDTSASLLIGNWLNNNFLGQMDDVRVYNYDLTAQQVKDIYNGGAVNFR